MPDENVIGFTIEHYNIEQNSITVRPFSPLFQKPHNDYPCFNISISNLDPLQNIENQIASLTQPIVETILKHEQNQAQGAIKEFLEINKNNLVTVNRTTLIPQSTVSSLQEMQETGILEVVV